MIFVTLSSACWGLFCGKNWKNIEKRMEVAPISYEVTLIATKVTPNMPHLTQNLKL